MTNRAQQINEMVQAHSGHRSAIGQTKTFISVRQLQGKLLAGKSRLKKILLLGCGPGDEAEAVFQFAKIDASSLEIYAVDVSTDRLAQFGQRFPQAQVCVADFSRGLSVLHPSYRTNLDLIQMGFVLNDQTEEGKDILLKESNQALNSGGALMIAEIIMDTYPNLASALPDAQAIASVSEELAQYYGAYLTEVGDLQFQSEESKEGFIVSINKAWQDALLHKDGRECFDTQVTMDARLKNAGFENIKSEGGYNKSRVFLASKSRK